MVSEARALLNEDIAALKALRVAAQLVYMQLAALPAKIHIAGDDTDSIASHLAWLVTDQRIKLDACLNRAEHWLGPTNPVYVPVPRAEGEYQSACDGAATLLMVFAILTECEAGLSGLLKGGTDELAQALAGKFHRDGVPNWLLSVPVDELKRLAGTVSQETDAAIHRITKQFQSVCGQVQHVSDSTNSQLSAPASHSPPPKKGKRSTRRIREETALQRHAVFQLWKEFSRNYRDYDYTKPSYELFAQWATGKLDDMPSYTPGEVGKIVDTHTHWLKAHGWPKKDFDEICKTYPFRKPTDD